MAGEDVCEHDMLVQIRRRGRKTGRSSSPNWRAMIADESTEEAIGDWHY